MKTIALCEAEPLCVELASHYLRVAISRRDGRPGADGRREAVRAIPACPKHKAELEQHCNDRSKENPDLSITIRNFPIETPKES